MATELLFSGLSYVNSAWSLRMQPPYVANRM